MAMAACFTSLLISSLVGFGWPTPPEDRPQPIPPAEGLRQARELIANMLAQRPYEDATNTGLLQIRLAGGQRREVPVRFEIFSTPTNWQSAYEATGPDGRSARLLVVHQDRAPNQYLLFEPATANAPRTLVAGETMAPFAGSDFWAADLGLEFLHWPQQRVLRKEMRHSQPCAVLESINPNPSPGGYTRVLSWIDLDPPYGVIHADAFDANNKRLKQFDPTKVKKIRGQYQLKEMEMLNEKTGLRTVLTLDLNPD